MNGIKEAIQMHFGGDYTPFFRHFIDGLKPGGAGNLKARCPFHNDQVPSLSIGISDGRWNCKGCGAKGDAFDFYARKHSLDAKTAFPEVLRGIADSFGIKGGNGTGKAAERRVVKIYDYRDTAGNVVFRKLRYELKSFSLCRPNGANGWINGMDGRFSRKWPPENTSPNLRPRVLRSRSSWTWLASNREPIS